MLRKFGSLLPGLMVALVATLWLETRSDAAIQFSLTPPTQTVAAGTTARFDLFLTPDVNVNMGGFTVNVASQAGTFSSGNFALLIGTGAGQEWDLISTPGEAYSTYDSFSQNPANPPTAALTANVPVLFGSLFLDTTGVSDGTYSVSFTENGAISGLGGDLGGTNAGPVSFTIAAVPEPTSLALLSVVGCGLLVQRRQKKA